MINIRRNCFETNSSSMHSLVVSKLVKSYTKEELALGYDDWDKERNRDFDLWQWMNKDEMYFERSPFQVLRTPLKKLQYYSAYVLGGCEPPRKTDIKRIQDFIMKQTGITDRKKIILGKADKDYYKPKKYRKTTFYGCVSSNDSGEDPMHYVKKHNISMEELILNPKYTIIVDGDESQLFKSLFDCGIINAEDLEDISSGADYWNDADYIIYDLALYKNSEEQLKEWLTEGINPLVKNVVFRFEFTDDKEDEEELTDKEKSIQEFNKDIEVIKNLITYAKKLNPNIKAVFSAYTYSNKCIITMKDLIDLDLSMFDKVEIENHDDERW